MRAFEIGCPEPRQGGAGMYRFEARLPDAVDAFVKRRRELSAASGRDGRRG
jgi:hypothetical protein